MMSFFQYLDNSAFGTLPSYRCVLAGVGPDSGSVKSLYRLISCVPIAAKFKKRKITCKNMPLVKQSSKAIRKELRALEEAGDRLR